MAGSDENNHHPNVMRQTTVHQDGGMKVAAAGGRFVAPIGNNNRRALRDINRNIIGVQPHACAVNKRPLLEDAVGCEKNPLAEVHRPITRRFAAQLACTRQSTTEGTKKPNQAGSSSIEPDDCVIIDAEDSEAASDPVPMFVQHTEAMLDEIDRMEEEIEMEDVDENNLLDIDGSDKDNPLAVTEYVDEIYAYYKRVERMNCVAPNYMVRQDDINERMRGILIDWLIEVHYKFELMEETLYLTVNLIDRFLAIESIVRRKLQLVGVTAMLLACKYEEVSVPVVEDLILICDRAYTRQEVLQMEKLMVNSLHFNLSVPTPYVFMRRFLKVAQSDKKLELLSYFMIELCLVEYEMLRFPPSLLAAAAIYTAQCTLNGSKQWNKTFEWHTAYSQEQLLECSRLMVTFHQTAGSGRLTGVHRKYSTSRFGYAAKSEPAQFLLKTMSTRLHSEQQKLPRG